MGPFKHKIDDGLDARKLAFEIMFTLLESHYSELDHDKYLDITIQGLSDPASDIRLVNHMALQKLCFVDLELVVARFEQIVACLEVDIFAKSKPNAVKQEIEKIMETVRSAARLVYLVKKLSNLAVVDALIGKMNADGGLSKSTIADLVNEVEHINA